MKATPEQSAAIQVQDRALLVEAGAGTGKTWVLVQRFLHLLETNPDWPLESIVAITFTEKAAREMRTRLRRAVEERAAKESASDSPWIDHRRALDQLQVSTIHGLCARILRENAIAAEIDPRFEVLDEQETDILKEEAVQAALAGLVEADSPALELLAALRVRDVQDELADLLDKRGTFKLLFEDLAEPDELLDRWRKGLAEMRQSLWEACLREDPDLSEALDDVPARLIRDPEDKLANSVGLAQKGCLLYAQGDLSGAAETWLQIDLRGGKKDNWGGADEFNLLKDQLRSLREAARTLEKHGALQEVGPNDEQAARALQRWRQAWDRVEAVYDQLKRERHALDFDDLEMLAAELLAEQADDDRLRGFMSGINHLMVDEFQDTNQTQRDIVYALAPPRDPGRLFVVGDAKQSIYRFRQAQVTIFNRTGMEIEELTGHPPARLSRSFRTHGGLLTALNRLFDRILAPLGDEYADFEAQPGALNPHRNPPPVQEVAPAPVEVITLPARDAEEENVSAEQARIWEARLLAARLHELQSGGFLVWDKGKRAYRPFRFDDAAILFRATTSLPLYETEFKLAGLPYLTVSGRGYYDRPEVQDLISLLIGLYNPGDDLNLATALRSPLFSLSDETLYRLRWRSPDNQRAEAVIPFIEALRQPPPTDEPAAVNFAAGVLADLWSQAGQVDVWRLARRALDRTGYEATLALSDADQGGGGRQLNNVHKFMELARQWGGADLSEFLRRIQDLRAREAREGEALGSAPQSGAVQLMSIHAAKGLEFPVVVVADLGRAGRGGFGSPRILGDPVFGLACKYRDANGDWQKPAGYAWAEWLHGRMESAESKRLLYVACTRAADLLILSGKLGRSGTWLDEIMAAWDILPEGEADDLLQEEGFAIRVLRPLEPPEEPERQPRPAPGGPALRQMPPLARPLPDRRKPGPMAATLLAELAGEAGASPPVVRPAVRAALMRGAAVERIASLHAPSYLIGRLVHRALADWVELALPFDEWNARLPRYTRALGITEPAAVEDAVGRARRMLDNLRRAELYRKIVRAPQRRAELPFTLTTPRGQIHGAIDLLYQDTAGGWHLLDWKTAWVPRPDSAERAKEHLEQLAVYAAAARQVLGGYPECSLCFLNPGLIVHRFETPELQAALDNLGVLGP